MLSLTKRVDYGLIALTSLASSEGPVSARDLAESYQLSSSLLANVLKELAGAGLVASVRGKKGGYTLKLDPAFVTVGRVVEALEGPFQLADCTGVEHAEGCELSLCCNIKWTVNKIHQRILETLQSVTIADIIAESIAGKQKLFAEQDNSSGNFQQLPLNLEV